MIGNYYYGTGRRKTAVARVFLKQGSGKFIVNEKPVDEFFTRETGRMVVRQPLRLTNHEATFDIMVNVRGGGESGQAGAVRHGITRALIAQTELQMRVVGLRERNEGIRQERDEHSHFGELRVEDASASAAGALAIPARCSSW